MKNCSFIHVLQISDTDSSSETDSESSKKPELQKTRSRTVKQKQQEVDSPSSKENAKESVVKRKTLMHKRTRSGSVKSDTNEPPKKRKYTKSDKTNKGSTMAGNIRHTIKTFVSRKRSNRIRDLSKDSKPASSDVPSNDEAADAIDDVVASDKEMDEAPPETTSPKKVTAESPNPVKVKPPAEEPSTKDPEEMLMILEIPPLNAEKITSLETEVGEPDSKIDSDASSVNVSPPILKKEVLTFEEMNNIRILATSYLAENLDSKQPKMVKSGGAKLKKEGEEPKMSPSKTFARSPNEKASKTCDGKEKTFFPSRAVTPTSEKSEAKVGSAKKFELCDAKDKKDVKIRSVTTLNSYLAMDKIDSIKKVMTTPEKSSPDKSEKSTPGSSAAKSVAEFAAFGGEDDIYEFKEPEPLEFRGIDDRTILHRRPPSRIFEDGNVKRTKTSPTASDSIIKENDDGRTEEISLEVKPIPAAKDDAKSVGEWCEKAVVETTSNSTKSNDIKVETKELARSETLEVGSLSLQIETVVGPLDEDTLQIAESLSVAPLVESLDEEDEAKLVIVDSSVSGASAILTDELVETVTSSIMTDEESVPDSKKKAASRVVSGGNDKEVPATESGETSEGNRRSVESEAVICDTAEKTSDASSNVEKVEKVKSTISSPSAPDQDLTVKTSTVAPDSTATSSSTEATSKTSVKSEDSPNESVARKTGVSKKINLMLMEHAFAIYS